MNCLNPLVSLKHLFGKCSKKWRLFFFNVVYFNLYFDCYTISNAQPVHCVSMKWEKTRNMICLPNLVVYLSCWREKGRFLSLCVINAIIQELLYCVVGSNVNAGNDVSPCISNMFSLNSLSGVTLRIQPETELPLCYSFDLGTCWYIEWSSLSES